MVLPDQKKKLLKAKIAVALHDELGRVPKKEEIEQVFLMARVMYKAVLGLHYKRQGQKKKGIHLRRDNPSSVRYAKELDSNKSSATLQRTDRHGILGQKPCDFQLPLWQRQAKHSTTGPSQRVFQE